MHFNFLFINIDKISGARKKVKAYIQGKTDISESENDTLSGRRQKLDSINIIPKAPSLSSSLFGESLVLLNLNHVCLLILIILFLIFF